MLCWILILLLPFNKKCGVLAVPEHPFTGTHGAERCQNTVAFDARSVTLYPTGPSAR
jgi:hypothetical protein